MKIDVLTLFPEMFESLNHSILKRAQESGALEVNLINFRDFSKDPHKKVDDYPFGGGAGMLLSAGPIVDAALSVKTETSRVVYMSPRGKLLNYPLARELAKSDHLIVICGHYEGVDERALQILGAEEVSIGDYVLTGGELPAMVLIDCVSRFAEGVLKEGSLDHESFTEGLLEYPQYTRPQEFMGLKVPEVLISGNHAEIEKWRRQESLKLTKTSRPDLLD